MVLIRADGNQQVGVGHVMRCLSIADAFKEKNEEVIFATADDNMKETIESRGYLCVCINSDYKDLCSDYRCDKYLELIQGANIILVDSYFADEEYYRELRSVIESSKTIDDNSDLLKKISARIVCMDDLCEKAVPVDILINYNIYADKKKYDDLYGCSNYEMPELILGPEYAPLRKEFSEGKSIEVRDKVSDILILTGGSDSLHIAKKIYNNLLEKDLAAFRDIRFHFVIGAMSQDYDELKKRADEYNKAHNSSAGQIMLHRNVINVCDLMRECDLAVSAAGSTLYELCACGVPTITYVLADNQIQGEKEFTKEGIMSSLGDARNDDFSLRLIKELEDLISNVTERNELSRRALKMCDGLGAFRIVDRLTNQ